MKQVRSTLLSAVDASVNQISGIVDSNQLFAGSIQAVSTGTAAGALKIQVSNQYEPLSEPQNYLPTQWSDVSGLSVSVTAASVTLIPKFDICYRWIRLVYTASSGTGTLTASLFAQSV